VASIRPSRDAAAWIAGAFEHPTRLAPDVSTAELHRECAAGALADAGLGFDDVDGYFGGRDVPGSNVSWQIDYLNIRPRVIDSTDTGGCSPLAQLSHAADAIAAGRCEVALITLAGRPRSEGMRTGTAPRPGEPERPDSPWEVPYRQTITTLYAMMTARHMHEYGTTPEQLAEVAVTIRRHAGLNPNAHKRDPVSVADVLSSKMITSPLHILDCAIVSDGAAAAIVTSAARARDLRGKPAHLLGQGYGLRHSHIGDTSLTTTGAVDSGRDAFRTAGLSPADVDVAQIYDCFTITVIVELEDLGFCRKGEGGAFVEGGRIGLGGELPVTTHGGLLSGGHPGLGGGFFHVLEGVRQVRGDAGARQVPGAKVALVHGNGGVISVHCTLLLGSEAAA
jgi:acetyl-CoA C-acetyltransferase